MSTLNPGMPYPDGLLEAAANEGVTTMNSNASKATSAAVNDRRKQRNMNERSETHVQQAIPLGRLIPLQRRVWHAECLR